MGPSHQAAPARAPEPAPGPPGKRSLADRLRELEANGGPAQGPAPEPEPDAPPPTDEEALATLQAAFPDAVVETVHQNG